MKHEEMYADYKRLTQLAGGGPFDCAKAIEEIGDLLMGSPTVISAKVALIDMIQMFADRGGPDGSSLRTVPEAIGIFKRYGY